MKKKLIDTSTSGVIATITPVFAGGASTTMVYTKVNGFQSFNNDLFTINSGTGEISLNSTQSEGRYYCRYRATRADNILQYIEDVLILDVSSEDAPTGSTSNEYDDSILPGDIAATVTSTFPSPEFELQYREADMSSASAEQAAMAFEIDASGNIRWTGDVDATEALNYKYLAVVRSSTNGCFSSTVEVEINYVQTIPADCPFPGLASFSLCNPGNGCDLTILHGSMHTDNPVSPISSASMIDVRADMEDFNGSTEIPRPGAALISFRDNGPYVRLMRVFMTYNFAGLSNPHMRLKLRMGSIPLPFPGALDPPYVPDLYVVYFNGVVPNGPGNNEASLISTWPVVQTISLDFLTPTIAQDVDVKLDFLTPGTSNVGLIFADDYNNDFSFMDTIPNNGQSNEGEVQAELNYIYDCAP